MSNFRLKITKVIQQERPLTFLAQYGTRFVLASLGLYIPSFLKLVPLSIRRNGYTLPMVPTPLSARLYRFPNYLKEDDLFIQSYLRSGDVYVDVGANIGFTTLAAAVKVGGGGKVYAFEPHERTYAFLKQTINANPKLASRIHTKMTAVGKIGDVGVYLTDYTWDDANHLTEGGGKLVPVAALDDIVGSERKISLLKLDVEGYEKFVLEGAQNTLAKTDTVYFEVCEKNYQRFGYSFVDMHKLLKAAGFSIYVPTYSTMALTPVNADYQPQDTFENLVATKNLEACLSRLRDR